MKPDMSLKYLGHQAVDCAAARRDYVQYLGAVLFLVQRFFDRIDLAANAADPIDKLFLVSNRMRH